MSCQSAILFLVKLTFPGKAVEVKSVSNRKSTWALREFREIWTPLTSGILKYGRDLSCPLSFQNSLLRPHTWNVRNTAFPVPAGDYSSKHFPCTFQTSISQNLGEVDFHFALCQFWSWFFSIEEQLFIPQQIDRKRWNKLGKADVFLVKYTLSGHEWVLMEKWLFPVFRKLVVECGPRHKWKL